jgi:hypothetical protein
MPFDRVFFCEEQQENTLQGTLSLHESAGKSGVNPKKEVKVKLNLMNVT